MVPSCSNHFLRADQYSCNSHLISWVLGVDGYCRCEEPVNYVSEIQNRYDHYVQIVPMQ